MAEYFKSVSDTIESAAQSTAEAVRSTAGDKVADTIKTSGHTVAGGVTGLGSSLGYKQDATSQATDSAKNNLEAAKDSTAAAASDMKVAGKETLSQVKQDFKAASDEGHQKAEQKAADAHGKTSSFLSGLSEQVSAAVTDAQKTTSDALVGAAEKIKPPNS